MWWHRRDSNQEFNKQYFLRPNALPPEPWAQGSLNDFHSDWIWWHLPQKKKKPDSLEHLLMSKTEQKKFILNENRACLGLHSKWTNFVQKTTHTFYLVNFFNKRHYEDRFHQSVKINSENERKNHSGGGGNFYLDEISISYFFRKFPISKPLDHKMSNVSTAL